jgi:hypothetical protein
LQIGPARAAAGAAAGADPAAAAAAGAGADDKPAFYTAAQAAALRDSAAAAAAKADNCSADFPSGDAAGGPHGGQGSSVDGWGVRLVRGGATNGGLAKGALACEFVGRLAPADRPDVAAALARQDR